MEKLIENFEQRYLLGLEAMDGTHREFAELVNRLGSADKAGFISLFRDLHEHTKAHFAQEQQRIEPATVSGRPASPILRQ